MMCFLLCLFVQLIALLSTGICSQLLMRTLKAQHFPWDTAQTHPCPSQAAQSTTGTSKLCCTPCFNCDSFSQVLAPLSVLGGAWHEPALAISQTKGCRGAQRQQKLSARNDLKERPLVPL